MSLQCLPLKGSSGAPSMLMYKVSPSQRALALYSSSCCSNTQVTSLRVPIGVLAWAADSDGELDADCSAVGCSAEGVIACGDVEASGFEPPHPTSPTTNNAPMLAQLSFLIAVIIALLNPFVRGFRVSIFASPKKLLLNFFDVANNWTHRQGDALARG